MLAVADLSDYSEQLNAAATNPSLDPADRVADVRRIRLRLLDAGDPDDLDVRALLGHADTYMGDIELEREAGAMGQHLMRAKVREDADIRDTLIAQGIATSDELDAAGWPSHDELDGAEADGTLTEAMVGAMVYKDALHPRNRSGEWRDKPGVVKMHGRGGGTVTAAAKPASYPRFPGIGPRPAKPKPSRPLQPAVMAVSERWKHLDELNKAAQDAKRGDPTGHPRMGIARAKIDGSLVHAHPDHHDAIMHHTHAAAVGSLPPEPVDLSHAQRDTTDHALAHMFKPEETAKPQQSFGSAEALYAAAEEALPEFTSILGDDGFGGEIGAVVPASSDEALANATDRPEQPQIRIGNIKKMPRAKQKVETKYDGDWDRLQDVVRASVIVPTLDDLPATMDAMRRHADKHGWKIAKAENRFADDDQEHNTGPTAQGYRDAAIALVSPSGLVTEVQISTAPMYEAKQGEGHHMYEESRTIEADIKTRMATAPQAGHMASPGGPTADELKRLGELEQESKALYNRAFEASYG